MKISVSVGIWAIVTDLEIGPICKLYRTAMFEDARV
jgi:hypothetical protein